MEEYHILGRRLSSKPHLSALLIHVRFGSKADIEAKLLTRVLNGAIMVPATVIIAWLVHTLLFPITSANRV